MQRRNDHRVRLEDIDAWAAADGPAGTAGPARPPLPAGGAGNAGAGRDDIDVEDFMRRLRTEGFDAAADFVDDYAPCFDASGRRMSGADMDDLLARRLQERSQARAAPRITGLGRVAHVDEEGYQWHYLYDSDSDSDYEIKSVPKAEPEAEPEAESPIWSDPTKFLPPGMPMPKMMKPDEVRQEAQARSKAIFAARLRLYEILTRHEATIQKRWWKKTRPQRLSILLKAWPHMAASHRPDFDMFRKKGRDRDAYIWPDINQEDLSKPKPLLLLLNSRGRHLPSAFAAADGESMHIGKVTAAVMPIFLNEHVMILNGASTQSEYGKLVAWEDHPDAFDWMHTRKQLLPGEGLLILEAQERLLTFLVTCTELILHEYPANELTSDKFPVQLEPLLKSEADVSGFDSLPLMAAEAPYRVPAQLDLGRIESLLEARKAAAEDDMWALREDPAYFAERWRTYQDHRQEMLPDINGKPHPTTSATRQHILSARIFGNILADGYESNEIYSALLVLVRDLKTLQKKYSADLSPSEDLPQEYLLAILRLRYFLQQAAKGPMELLKYRFCASPPVRTFFARQPPPNATTSMISVQSTGARLTKTQGAVLWLVRTLWEDGRDLFLLRLPLVIDELQRLLESDKEGKAMISAQIASHISDLSIISQCLAQLDLYQPWANSYENQMVVYEPSIKKEFEQSTASFSEILAAIKEQNLYHIAQLAEPSGGKFSYPIAKRRTKENVEALRRAEMDLDALWASVDKLIYDKAGCLGGTATTALLSQPRVLQRTPDWVEPPRKGAANAATASQVPQHVAKPLSSFYYEIQGQRSTTTGRGVLSATKSKPKTKGMAQELAPADGQGDNLQPVPADVQPTFAVDARAYKVFRTLFFDPETTSSPGEIKWADFLHAMTSVGFMAEKLYGSVWQFRPIRLDVERPIQIHEPHPHDRIPFLVARRHGRRLFRAYGWVGSMFVNSAKTN